MEYAVDLPEYNDLSRIHETVIDALVDPALRTQEKGKTVASRSFSNTSAASLSTTHASTTSAKMTRWEGTIQRRNKRNSELEELQKHVELLRSKNMTRNEESDQEFDNQMTAVREEFREKVVSLETELQEVRETHEEQLQSHADEMEAQIRSHRLGKNKPIRRK
ncbi:hypothetical protein K440DRAFT_635892 [Wilcoxina mikolae CBS 423.85]|nr:hypothetical protein K440DRAFT_635892 [Wilcoxina mikolae CBS 423.85]